MKWHKKKKKKRGLNLKNSSKRGSLFEFSRTLIPKQAWKTETTFCGFVIDFIIAYL